MVENKKDITRANLQLHGISYVEEVYSCDNELTRDSSCVLPNHVDAVREVLLSFEGLIPEDWRQDLDYEFKEYGSKNLDLTLSLQPPASAFFRLKKYVIADPGPELKAVCERLRMHEGLADKARDLRDDAESGWCFFWRVDFFKIFEKKHGAQRGHEAIFDAWSLEQDVTWTEFPKWELPNEHPKGRTRPKPDLTYAFPILKAHLEPLKGFERDEFIKCFSFKVLRELRRDGILSAPTTGLFRSLRSPLTKLRSPDYSCFPWAVVEMKREHESVERCYCQAANAAAAALTLHAQLLEKSSSSSFSPVPPVIAFTCVGPNVRVWLAYQTSDISGRQQQRMVCIWSTSVQLTWGVTALNTILMNMHIWAARSLKPKISSWIIQASEKLTPRTPGTPNTPTSRKLKTPTSRKPNTPTARQLETPTRQCTPNTLFSSSQVNTPSSSCDTPVASNWSNLQSAASSLSTPMPQEKIASTNSSVVPLDESVFTDTKGKAHDGALVAVSESYDQNDIGEVIRMFQSSKLENSDSKDNGGSIKSMGNEENGENGLRPGSDSASIANSEDSVRSNGDELDARGPSGKDSRLDLKFVEIEEDSIRSSDAESEGENGEELDNDLEYELEDESEDDSDYDYDYDYDSIRPNDIELEGESGEELENDSEYESEDKSEDNSDHDSKFDEDPKGGCKSEQEKGDSQTSRPFIDVSEEDIKAWRRVSLQALSGKQIIEMPIIATTFWGGRTANWMTTIQRGLEFPNSKLHIEDKDALEKLLSHLNLFLEPGIFISTDAFRKGQADGLIHCALQNAQTIGPPGHNAWLCFKYALSCWTGYKCVEILSAGLTELTAEEREKMEIDAFAILNNEDQSSGLLR